MFSVKQVRVIADINENEDVFQQVIVKIKKDGKEIKTTAEANSAVEALHEAFKKGLMELFSPEISSMRLVQSDESSNNGKVIVMLLSEKGEDQWVSHGEAGEDVRARVKAVTRLFKDVLKKDEAGREENAISNTVHPQLGQMKKKDNFYFSKL